MKISDLLKKLAGRDPEEEVKDEDLKEPESESQDAQEPEQPAQDEQEVKEEKPEEEAVEDKPVEEVKEAEPVEEAKEDSSAEIDALKAQIAEMEAAKAEAEAKMAELEKNNADLAAAKDAADAKTRLDSALQAGWLLPAMLKEADDKESVFVDMAKNYPELFERLSLVMAPKALPKHGMTEAPAVNGGSVSEEELVKRIKQLAAEKGISYAEAAHLI